MQIHRAILRLPYPKSYQIKSFRKLIKFGIGDVVYVADAKDERSLTGDLSVDLEKEGSGGSQVLSYCYCLFAKCALPGGEPPFPPEMSSVLYKYIQQAGDHAGPSSLWLARPLHYRQKYVNKI
jgi:hypothetical protein